MYLLDKSFNVNYILAPFTVIEYLLFSYYLYLIIRIRTFNRIILILSILFVVLSTYHFFFLALKGITSFDTIPAVVECILVIAYTILFLFDQIKTPQSLFIYNTKSFWAVAGMLIYLSSTFFLFAFADTLGNERDNLWFINLYANILKNILFAISMYIKETPSRHIISNDGYIKFEIDENKFTL
jgi:hypothetical protein